MGFLDKLFGAKPAPEKERERVYVTNDLGRHHLLNTDDENLDGSSRQKNLQKCLKLEDSNEYVNYFYECKREIHSVVAVHDKETKRGESKDVHIGIVGEVPESIILELRSTKGDRVSLLLDEPSFERCTLENGKKGIAISLRARITWHAYEVRLPT